MKTPEDKFEREALRKRIYQREWRKKQGMPGRPCRIESDSLAPAMLSHTEVDWLVRVLERIRK